MEQSITSVVIAGLGGQGVLKASDILAEAAFIAGLDVKKSEIHGMSQRGGSVHSDVRFGRQVWSPLIEPAGADFLVLLAEDQLAPNQYLLRSNGTVISAERVALGDLPSAKSLNVALLGVLSSHLKLPEAAWIEALNKHLSPKFIELNLRAFDLGRLGISQKTCSPAT